MTFTKLIAAADANHCAKIKFAYVVAKGGRVIVTEMQTNSNGLDCQWTSSTEAEAAAALQRAGYELAASA